MRILVTGGLGTLGRRLAGELQSRGHDVFSLDISHGGEEAGFSLRTDVSAPVKRVDVSKAVRDLGHRTTVPLEEGMRRTNAWMREVYKL